MKNLTITGFTKFEKEAKNATLDTMPASYTRKCKKFFNQTLAKLLQDFTGEITNVEYEGLIGKQISLCYTASENLGNARFKYNIRTVEMYAGKIEHLSKYYLFFETGKKILKDNVLAVIII